MVQIPVYDNSWKGLHRSFQLLCNATQQWFTLLYPGCEVFAKPQITFFFFFPDKYLKMELHSSIQILVALTPVT